MSRTGTMRDFLKQRITAAAIRSASSTRRVTIVSEPLSLQRTRPLGQAREQGPMYRMNLANRSVSQRSNPWKKRDLTT